jgi:hypothetical protein
MPDSNTLTDAMFSPAFPVNPRPFARGLDALIQEQGTNAIRSDEAKRLLWVLMAQAYGQIATVDLCAEWSRLDASRQATLR